MNCLDSRRIEPDSSDNTNTDASLSGFGAPALMSLKEPAIRLLKERYSESFAFTKGTDKRIHVFLIRIGLWALVYTFTPKDISRSNLDMADALTLVEDSLVGRNDLFKERLDTAIRNATSRLQQMTDTFRTRTAR